MNVDIFLLYISSCNLHVLDIRENMYTVKITFSIAQRENNTKNANLNPSEIALFVKYVKYRHAKISTFTVCLYIYIYIHIYIHIYIYIHI